MITRVIPPSVFNVSVTFSPAFNAFFKFISSKCGPAGVSSSVPYDDTVISFAGLSPLRSSIFPAASLVASTT